MTHFPSATFSLTIAGPDIQCGKCGMNLKVKDKESHERIFCVNREVACNWCGEWTIFRKVQEHKRLKCQERRMKAGLLRDAIFHCQHAAIEDLLEDGVTPTLDAEDPLLVELGVVSTEGLQYDEGGQIENSTLSTEFNKHSTSVIATETNIPLVSRPTTKDGATRVYKNQHPSAGVAPGPEAAIEIAGGTQRTRGRSPNDHQRGDEIIPEDFQQWYDDTSFKNPDSLPADYEGKYRNKRPNLHLSKDLGQSPNDHGVMNSTEQLNSSLGMFSRINQRCGKDKNMMTDAFEDHRMGGYNYVPQRWYTRDYPALTVGMSPSEEFSGTMSTMLITGGMGPPSPAQGGQQMGKMNMTEKSFSDEQQRSSLQEQQRSSLQHRSLAFQHDPDIALDIAHVDKNSRIDSLPGPNLYLGLALHCAVQAGDLDSLKILCRREGDVDLFLRDNFGCTCLHLAAMKGRCDLERATDANGNGKAQNTSEIRHGIRMRRHAFRP
eukprot:g12299.t1